jgi:hypothetical protein
MDIAWCNDAAQTLPKVLIDAVSMDQPRAINANSLPQLTRFAAWTLGCDPLLRTT